MTDSMNLRERLLRHDQWTPQTRAKYQQEITKMMHSPLTPMTRALTITGCILGLVAGVGLGCLFVQEDVPAITSIGLGVMSIGGLNMAAYCGHVLHVGGRSRIRHGLWHALHLTTLSTLFLVMALAKQFMADGPGMGTETITVAAIVQWVLVGILPLILWRSQVQALERRQAEILALLHAQQDTARE
jgi:hypothetical protein